MFCLFWYSYNKQILEFKSDIRAQYQRLENRKLGSIIRLDPFKDKEDKIAVDIKELEKLNDYINSAFLELKKENNRAESIIDKDLDRLSLFMTVGIGFMSLLGVFVPILVNINSKEDHQKLQSNFDTLKDSFDLLNDEFKDLEPQKAKIDKYSKSIYKLEVNTINAKLQSAIGRLYYVGPIHLKEFSYTGKPEKLMELFNNIKDSYFSCENLEDFDETSDPFFNKNTSDFISFLNSEKYRMSIVLNQRKDNTSIDEIIISLSNLIDENSKEDKRSRFRLFYNSIDRILETLKEKDNAIKY
jgi:cell division protein FtsB